MEALLARIQDLYTQTQRWVWQQIVVRQLASPLGLALVLLAMLVTAYLVAKGGLLIGGALFVLVIGAMVLLLSSAQPHYSFYLAVIVSPLVYFIPRFLLRFIPLGILVDGIVYLGFINALIDQWARRKRKWSFIRNTVAFFYAINIVYLLLQAFNPNVSDLTGYLAANRREITNLITFLLIGYCCWSNPRFVPHFVVFWMIYALVCAIYGCYQEWYGLSNFEIRWLFSNEAAYDLIFIDGRFRKFSFLVGPTSFGIFMAMTALLAAILALGPFARRVRLAAGVVSVFAALGLAYSGTRTAFAMIVAGLLLYVLMTINQRRTLIFAASLATMSVVLLFGPFYGNPTINRLRGTFEGSDDPSMNVRNVNRQSIQPYIYAHPMGGGINTAGAPGEKYYPEHPLAGFPPDSGLLQIVLETGYIGLILKMLFYFATLRAGLRSYYRSRDPVFRTYMSGFTSLLFAVTVAQYSQAATAFFPEGLFYYGAIAILANAERVEQYFRDGSAFAAPAQR